MEGQAEQTGEKEVKKAITKKLFLSLLFLVLLLIAGFSVVISPAFSLGTVRVEGNFYMAENEILEIAGIPESINIFRLNTVEIEERLSKDLRIETAQITRNFPSQLTISIKERQPIAYVACDYGFVEIDRNGMAIMACKNLKNIQVPMITGIILHNIYIGDQVDDPVIKQALVYLAALDEESINKMSEINIKDKNQLVAYTNNSVQIRIGGLENLAEKARLTQGFLADANVKQLPIEYIDFNFTSPFIKVRQ